MKTLYQLRKEAERAEKRASDLYREREKLEREKFAAQKEIFSMPCDTVGWTDEELSSHIYHMHDSIGYVHVHGMPRKIMEAIHDLIKDHKRRWRSEDND